MRPYVLSIAGLDPSGGAGLLADIKTFESHKVYGMGVCSALTMQNDLELDEVKWVAVEKIKKQIDVLFRRFEISYVKIGLIINLNILEEVIDHLLKKNSAITLIWDPILKSSSGFEFHQTIEKEKLFNICRKIALVTPNLPEMKKLIPYLDEKQGADYLSQSCPVLLKGGHSAEVIDLLFQNGKRTDIYQGEKLRAEKHGTGCVLSSAILANLAKGINLEESSRLAKKYIRGFLLSNKSQLGYHFKDYDLSLSN